MFSVRGDIPNYWFRGDNSWAFGHVKGEDDWKVSGSKEKVRICSYTCANAFRIKRKKYKV